MSQVTITDSDGDTVEITTTGGGGVHSDDSYWDNPNALSKYIEILVETGREAFKDFSWGGVALKDVPHDVIQEWLEQLEQHADNTETSTEQLVQLSRPPKQSKNEWKDVTDKTAADSSGRHETTSNETNRDDNNTKTNFRGDSENIILGSNNNTKTNFRGDKILTR